jgi:Cellulase (glycosyl hydrolase family 5)
MNHLARWLWRAALLAALVLHGCECEPSPVCGDGICEEGESDADCSADCGCGNGVCDEGETAADCPADCGCGDGVCDEGEGAVSCPADCYCGDGVVRDSEMCDGSDLGASCAELGYAGGELGCTATCEFDVSGCTNCGDGAVDAGEDCDGANLGGGECQDLGFLGGDLACQADCTFDAAGCLPVATGPLFGWGGYMPDIDQVIPILDDLVAGGYTAVRYWARPTWYDAASTHPTDFDILDLLVEEAAARGIVVYIDPEHNFPPGAYLDGHSAEWIADLKTVGQRYKDALNVVLECVNEYTGSDEVALYNQAVAELRADGIHLPLLFNFWWTQDYTTLDDPDGNYAIGRHLYGWMHDGDTMATPTTLADALAAFPDIVSNMYNYFENPGTNLYLQEVLALSIPNGWVVTEMGPTDTPATINDPGVGNMAWAMQFLREAADHGVSVICYRVGEGPTKAIYEGLALDFFGEPYFLP